MQVKKFLAVFVFLTLILTAVPSVFAGNPPVLQVDGERDGFVVHVTGSVEDENVDTVIISVTSGDGLASSFPVMLVNGEFSVDVGIGIGQESIMITAEDEEGKTDTDFIDIEF